MSPLDPETINRAQYLIKSLDGETSMTETDRESERRNILQTLASKFIEARLNTSASSESLRSAIINRLQNSLESMPIETCLEVLDRLNEASARDLEAFVGGGKESPLTLMIQNNQINAGGAAGVGTHSRAEMVNMNSISDALKALQHQAKQAVPEIIDAEFSEPQKQEEVVTSAEPVKSESAFQADEEV